MLLLRRKINGTGNKMADVTAHIPAAGQAFIDDVLDEDKAGDMYRISVEASRVLPETKGVVICRG